MSKLTMLLVSTGHHTTCFQLIRVQSMRVQHFWRRQSKCR